LDVRKINIYNCIDVRFIGELLIVGVIPIKAIDLCFGELLNNYIRKYVIALN